MKSLLKIAPVVLLPGLFLFSNSSFAQLTSRQKRNLDAFARLYGYVRYFHPADEVNKLNMSRFAEAGSLKMLNVKDDNELISTLKDVFMPIAPTIKIYATGQSALFNINSITPPDTSDFSKVYWQHLGMGFYPFADSRFISDRVNRQPKKAKKDVFTYPLSDTLNLAAFVGKRFTITVLARINKAPADGTRIRIEPWRDSLDNVEGVFSVSSVGGNMINTVQRKVTFYGIIDRDHPYISCKISGSANSVPISVDNVELTINDQDKSIPVLLKDSPYKDKHPAKPVAVYQLKFKNIEESVSPYPTSLKMGDVIKKEIVPGISVMVPLCLYGNTNYTYPKAAAQDITRLETDMYNTVKKDKDGNVIDSGNELDIRLANIVMSWSVISNAYPYWSRASKTPLEILNDGLERAMTDKTNMDFLTTLKEMYKPLNDGLFQAFLNAPGIKYNNFFAPLAFSEAKGKVVIAAVCDSSLSKKISPGDAVISIDRKPVSQLFKNVMQTISGSVQWQKWQALNSLTAGPENSVMQLTVNHAGKNETLNINRDRFGFFDGRVFVNRNEKPSAWVSRDIYYLNLANDGIPEHMKELQSANTVIIDLRNDNLNHDNSLFNYFARTGQHISLLGCPEIDRPDYENVRYKNEHITVTRQSPFTTKRLYFITDASTTGVLEELALYVKQYKLGKLVGSKTSGAFTGANTFAILGDYQVSFTGLKVMLATGMKTEDGIVPDVLVNASVSNDLIEAAIADAKKHK